MRIVLLALIGLHAIIHLFGFLQAFEFSEFNGISQVISKTSGLLWLVASLLFMVTAILYFIHSNIWWAFGLTTIVISQILIFNYWSDAKYGTIANLIVFVGVLLAYLNNNFQHLVSNERTQMFETSVKYQGDSISSHQISDLPVVVQKWMNYSGVIGKSTISTVFLIQDLQLKLKPEQENWSQGSAEQYFTIQPPSFNWDIETQMNPLMSAIGRDKFENGKGEMLIKLFGLIPVADVKNEEKINQAALQRYLAEIVWFPSAAMSEYLVWEEIDEFSAKATMEYNGTKGSGIFYFDEFGQFEKFTAMRFKSPTDSEPTEWTVVANRTEERNGIKIPTECEAIWSLESEKWTWLKLKIKHIEYNVDKMPVDKDISN